jgi:hypothetical protein
MTVNYWVTQCERFQGTVLLDRGCTFSPVSNKRAYGSSLGANPDIFQKYKMGDINTGVANTL